MSNIDTLVEHAQRIAAGEDERVQPGMPAAFTEACTPGDCIWQGDLGITIVQDLNDGSNPVPPEGYKLFNEDGRMVLLTPPVPNGGVGSLHGLGNVSTADVYVPADWGPKYEGLKGPFLVTKADTEITHPVHGNVTVPKNRCVQITFQREWDQEQQRERRARD